jgi:hypothetical protein
MSLDLVCIKRAKVDSEVFANIFHTAIDGIEERFSFRIVFGVQPFFLEFPPECFGNVQVRRIGRKKESEQSSCLLRTQTLPKRF